MPEFDAVQMVNMFMSGISKLGETVQLVREPIPVGNKIVIPAVVARLAVGAGGGSGRREGHVSADGHPRTGGGGGGGGGLTLSPVFLIVDEKGERLVTVPNAARSATDVIEKLSDVAESFLEHRRERQAAPAGAAQD